MRIPLNEDCWLSLNAIPEESSGTAYQDAIAGYVARIIAHGMTPILELHWSAPGTSLATGQWPMPDRDHSPEFWGQVAARFGNDTRVVFELFNEPYPNDNGGGADATDSAKTFPAAPGTSPAAPSNRRATTASASTSWPSATSAPR